MAEPGLRPQEPVCPVRARPLDTSLTQSLTHSLAQSLRQHVVRGTDRLRDLWRKLTTPRRYMCSLCLSLCSFVISCRRSSTRGEEQKQHARKARHRVFLALHPDILQTEGVSKDMAIDLNVCIDICIVAERATLSIRKHKSFGTPTPASAHGTPDVMDQLLNPSFPHVHRLPSVALELPTVPEVG